MSVKDIRDSVEPERAQVRIMTGSSSNRSVTASMSDNGTSPRSDPKDHIPPYGTVK